MRKPERPKSGVIFRCGIYTRKSSDDGLEQEFNSLDAQREACEAYVTSQLHAGWIALPDFYDDGGLSGGTMERPALAPQHGGQRGGTNWPLLHRNYMVDRAGAMPCRRRRRLRDLRASAE